MVKSIIDNNKSILDQSQPGPPTTTPAQEEAAIAETSLRLTREIFALARQRAKIMNGEGGNP